MIWIIILIAGALLIKLGALSVQQTRTLLEGALLGEKYRRIMNFQQDNLKLPVQSTSIACYNFRFRMISICSAAHLGQMP